MLSVEQTVQEREHMLPFIIFRVTVCKFAASLATWLPYKLAKYNLLYVEFTSTERTYPNFGMIALVGVDILSFKVSVRPTVSSHCSPLLPF